MINLIIRFLLASGLYVALLIGIYFGITSWNTAVKLSPEYKLISVAEALNHCDVEQFNQAVNLDAVIKNILNDQLKSDLNTQNNTMASGAIDDAMINQLLDSQLANTKKDFETNLAKCNFMSLDTKKMPFWVVPSLHLLINTRTVLGIASIRNSKLSDDKQRAEFTFRINAKELKDAEIRFQLAKKPKNTAENDDANQWQMVAIKLNEAALSKVMPAPTS